MQASGRLVSPRRHKQSGTDEGGHASNEHKSNLSLSSSLKKRQRGPNFLGRGYKWDQAVAASNAIQSPARRAKPQSLVCYLCGRNFGFTSLDPHHRVCMRAKYKAGEIVVDPPDEPIPLPTDSARTIDIYNTEAMSIFRSLYQCECGASFSNETKLLKHQVSCRGCRGDNIETHLLRDTTFHGRGHEWDKAVAKGHRVLSAYVLMQLYVTLHTSVCVIQCELMFVYMCACVLVHIYIYPMYAN